MLDSIQADFSLVKRGFKMIDSGDRGSSGKRKLFSLLCHGSIFFGPLLISILVPLAVLLTFDDAVIKETAKETLNYHLNLWFYQAIVVGLGAFFTFLIITIPLAWILGTLFFLFNLIPPIFGILATLSNPNETYRYPFILRVV
jgi:uncharacterized protein